MGVLANVSHILTPFTPPTFQDLFCTTRGEVNLESVLDGQLFLINIPLAAWGLGGKVACHLIKLRFFNVIQQQALNSTWNQTRSVFFLCNEYQEIISAN